MSMDRELIERFRDAVTRRYGLQFDDYKRDFLAEILTKQISRTNSDDGFSYVHRLLTGNVSQADSALLVAELTVGETYFFRHPDQFRALANTVLASPHGQPMPVCRRLHILSAGCASGEEAYSLAILLRQHLSEETAWDIRVVGVDLNPLSLVKAARARYTTWSLRGVGEDVRQRFFHGSDKDYQLEDSIRKLVSFEERNLLNDAPDFWRPESFDVIFCRNVIMYFSPEAARAVVDRLTRSLVPGGFLFLSPAETLRGVSNDYHLRHTHEAFYYQRRQSDEKCLQPSSESSPSPHRPPTSLPLLTDTDDSWVTLINEASERIARLGREMHSAAQTLPPPSNPGDGGRSTVGGKSLPGILTAHEMIRQERYADALRALDNPASPEIQDSDAQLLRAAILTNCGEVAEAERLCHDVLSRDELNAEARYLLALCREHAKEYAAAAEQDGIAIYLDPRFAMPHLHLGLLRKRARDFEGARRSFRTAITLLPGEEPSRILLFGGGFSREMLVRLCDAELRAGDNQP
jgi:chemotaxis protein methyltransferase CheR